MDDIKKGIQYVFQTKNELTLAISASGHGGMETVLCNLLEPDDKILIFTYGIWGDRAADIANRLSGVVIKCEKQNDNFSLEEIENAVRHHLPRFVFVVQGESSTGLYQPLEGIGEITRRYNAILIVDCVASLGAVPLLVDKWKIDVIYSGSQKIISAPPGLAPISFGSRAKNIIFNRTTPIKSYYWDIKLIGQQWNCFGENVARIYHHTTSAPLLFALREALAILAEEGLKNVITRHQECANILYDGLNKIGLELYIKDKCKRLPSVTSVKVPDEVNWRAVADFAMKNYNLEISGGLGPTMGKVFRIGLMGYNATNENVLTTLGILKESLNYARNKTNSKL
ncbi:alanine-glyoxylate aminotransferase isoform X2 [Rhynchophorus ferrugineus]